MIVRFNKEKTHDYEMIDFRETMPAAGNVTLYSNNSNPTASTIGGLAVGVPGELRGWEQLHTRHGKLPWKSLFQPAINLARNGFTVNAALAARLTGDNAFLTADPLWAEVYAPNGTLLKEGNKAFRKRYATTLENIAEHGADFFYKGEMAVNTAEAAFARGGILTVKDLANYTAIIRKPAQITYRNHRIFSTIAPSSGAVVLSALKIFEGFPGSASDQDPAINITTHRLLQGTRFGYGQRTNLGDPGFTANVSTLEQTFLLESTAAAARAKINDTHNFDPSFYDISNYIVLNDHGTSHMAAVDKSGMAVSLTTTVNLIWGSQVMTTDGVILNDEMDDFSSPGQVNSFGFAAAPVNFIAPGKRPQSSIASSIVEDLETGEFRMATGSAGGSRIITATLQNIHYHLDQGLSPSAALHHGRWHDQLTNVTLFEFDTPSIAVAGFPNATVAFLANINYNVSFQDTTGSAGHIISKQSDGSFVAASDPRSFAGGGSAF